MKQSEFVEKVRLLAQQVTDRAPEDIYVVCIVAEHIGDGKVGAICHFTNIGSCADPKCTKDHERDLVDYWIASETASKPDVVIHYGKSH